jgi:uncharacterized protein (TIGR02246 family)
MKGVTMSEMFHENDLKAIKAIEQKYTELFLRGDAAGLAALYTEDAVFMPPDADFLHGQAAIQQFFEKVISMGIKGPVFETVQVELYGDLAVELARYTLFGAGDVVVFKGKAIFVWKRELGEWKCHRDIFNIDMPPAA